MINLFFLIYVYYITVYVCMLHAVKSMQNYNKLETLNCFVLMQVTENEAQHFRESTEVLVVLVDQQGANNVQS